MKFVLVFILFTQVACTQSIAVKKKIDLPNKIRETSGIVYLKERKEIITFNDSGGKPELYVLNAKSGKLKRTVKVKNAKNRDWESITSDDTYIYVGDTGNNFGNRTNLVVYKIKIKHLKKKEVKAHKIHFKYQDQKDFGNNRHATNFDCEAITIYNNQLCLFTKNWEDFKTNMYVMPTEKGNHVAVKKHSFAIGCMLTSIAYSFENNLFIGTAYDRNYKSYLIKIQEDQLTSQAFQKISLFDDLGYANQIEAIAWKKKNKVYVTREASMVTVNGKKYDHKQKLIEISLGK